MGRPYIGRGGRLRYNPFNGVSAHTCWGHGQWVVALTECVGVVVIGFETLGAKTDVTALDKLPEYLEDEAKKRTGQKGVACSVHDKI